VEIQMILSTLVGGLVGALVAGLATSSGIVGQCFICAFVSFAASFACWFAIFFAGMFLSVFWNKARIYMERPYHPKLQVTPIALPFIAFSGAVVSMLFYLVLFRQGTTSLVGCMVQGLIGAVVTWLTTVQTSGC
jgi:hypothetical protein